MTINVQGVIQALSQAVEVSPLETSKTRFPVITLSRDFGTGGAEIAEKLAERLNIEIFDEDILDAVANRAEVNSSLLKALHEKTTSGGQAWLYSLVTGKNVSRDEYRQALVTVMRSIYHKGGIIIGRGAHVVLEGRDVFRLRLTGSQKTCAKRVANREKLTLTEAKKRCDDVNTERNNLVWNLFQSRLNEPSNFDLTVNTDNFESADQVVDILLQVMRMTGLDKGSLKED